MRKHIDWNKLRVFYYAARAGSLTAASENLCITQSAVSRQVSTLEEAIGCKLFHRKSHGIALTEEGEMIFDSISKVILEIEAINTLVEEKTNKVKGKLKITTTAGLANLWLPSYLPGFMEQFPDIRLSIIGHDKELDLIVREADVAIRPYVEGNPNLKQEYLTTFHLNIYASPEYLQKHGEPKNINDLDRHRLIVFNEYGGRPYGNINWILSIGRRPGCLRTPFMEINSSQGLMWAAETGMGIVALSKEYASYSSKIVRILKNCETPMVDLYYVYPKQLESSERISALGNYLKAKMREEELLKSA